MSKIVAIGGGELREETTLSIDQYICESTGKKKPNALFIPTASTDAETYFESFHKIYGEILGCQTDALRLFHVDTMPEQIRAKITWADLIYVGGGNTLRMMKLWRKRGVDQLLREAHQRGTILSGLSAGAICWFQSGHSDSMSFSANGKQWNYVRIKGLNLVKLVYCPHVDAENRREDFTRLVSKQPLVGVACDDNCALEIMDNQYRIIKSKPEHKAYKVYRKGNETITEILDASESYSPLSQLLKK